MSHYWHLHCVDCKVTLRFDNMNHAERRLLMLARHAEVIASLADLVNDQENCGDIRLDVIGEGSIDVEWFRAHLGHQLLPIDEYGALYGNCTEWARCACGTSRPCTLLAGHEGECRVVP